MTRRVEVDGNFAEGFLRRMRNTLTKIENKGILLYKVSLLRFRLKKQSIKANAIYLIFTILEIQF